MSPTLASPLRAPSETLASRPRGLHVTPEGPCGGPPLAPETLPTHPRAAPMYLRGGPQGSPAPPSPVRGGTPQGRGGGDRTLDELREVILVLDRDPPICPRCRERPRQYRGLNRRNGHRKYRMLCARCQRHLRVQAGFEDLPAPICRVCWSRHRAFKDYRRGRPHYRGTCGLCAKSARAVANRPYRGGASWAPC